MARTSAKAKKQKKDALKSKEEAAKQTSTESEPQDIKPASNSENTSDSTDKENDDNNYEVEKIVHTRLYRGKRQYLVRWKGYKEESDTWENESVVQSCGEALETFKKENPTLKSKDSDGEAEDEGTEDIDKEEKKGKKRSKTDVNKGSAKKVKKEIKIATSKKNNKEAHGSTESEEDIEDEKDEKVNKVNKKIDKGAKKVSAKKSKDTEASDNDSVTDGKNYEVEKILEVHTRKDGTHEFLIRWKGYRPSDDTWEPEAHLDCQDMIEKFMEKVEKAKNIPARELRESRTPTNRFIPNTKVKGMRSNLRNTGFRPSYQE